HPVVFELRPLRAAAPPTVQQRAGSGPLDDAGPPRPRRPAGWRLLCGLRSRGPQTGRRRQTPAVVEVLREQVELRQRLPNAVLRQSARSAAIVRVRRRRVGGSRQTWV